ncbi:MAG: carboxypeptidase-like regulatory domain-containing protein [Coriobacteriaceae bacterium]|jgi:hypothetical protein|nr:carboxypeptidase-like regulatory domain-containing protein [Coriobacteriaceae bacterium]
MSVFTMTQGARHTPEILVVRKGLVQLEGCARLTLAVRVSCPQFCDLRGTFVTFQAQGEEEAVTRELVSFNGVENETAEFDVLTGADPGYYCWTAAYGEEEGAVGELGLVDAAALAEAGTPAGALAPAGQGTSAEAGKHADPGTPAGAISGQGSMDAQAERPSHARVSHTLGFEYSPHRVSLAAWDIPMPVLATGPQGVVTLSIGAKCNKGCLLSGHRIRVWDAQGNEVASAVLGEETQEGTDALYKVPLAIPIPESEGPYPYTLGFNGDQDHPESRGSLAFFVAGKAEHMLTIGVLDAQTNKPVAGALVALHPHTGHTDAEGQAAIAASKGQACLRIKAEGYEPYQATLLVAADASLNVELLPKPLYEGDF